MLQGFLEKYRRIPSRFCVQEQVWRSCDLIEHPTYLTINLDNQKKELSISLINIKEILIYLYSIKVKKRSNFFEHIKRDFSSSLLSETKPPSTYYLLKNKTEKTDSGLNNKKNKKKKGLAL